MTLLVDYKQLSPSTLDVAMNVAEYAYPQTIEAAWSRLESLKDAERITEATYNEIKSNVQFVYDYEEESREEDPFCLPAMTNGDYDETQWT